MTGAEWVPIVQAVIAAVGVAITTLIGIFVPRAIAAFEKRTSIAMTDQERAAILSAVNTAAGLLQTKLDVGLLKARDVTPGNAQVLGAAERAMAAVPHQAAAQGTSVEAAATMIASRIDTTPRPTPVLAMVPPIVRKEPPV